MLLIIFITIIIICVKYASLRKVGEAMFVGKQCLQKLRCGSASQNTNATASQNKNTIASQNTNASQSKDKGASQNTNSRHVDPLLVQK